MLLKKILIGISIILITSNSFADVVMVHLNKGDQAPFPGNIFTEEKSIDIYNTYHERDAFKGERDSLQTSLNIEANSNSILKKDNATMYDALQKSKSSDDLQKILWFIGGVAVTALAVEGASKLR